MKQSQILSNKLVREAAMFQEILTPADYKKAIRNSLLLIADTVKLEQKMDKMDERKS